MSVLNFGLKGEYRVDHVNNVKDEYLTALQGLLVDCREWQRSAISNREWLEARKRFALVYTSKLDAAAVDAAIQKLGEVFTSGISDQADKAQAIQAELTSLREARDQDGQVLETRIRELMDLVENLREDVRTRSVTTTPMTSIGPGGPVVTKPEQGAEISGVERPNLKFQWTISFEVGQAAPDLTQLDQAAAALKTLKTREPATRFELTGFADTIGDERANLALAVRRVQVVRRALDNRGIHGATAVAVGETEAFGNALGANRVVLISAYLPAARLQPEARSTAR